MKHMFPTTLFILILLLILSPVFPAQAAEGDTVFWLVGAASKPAAELIIDAFEKKTGIKVEASFGGSGHLLSQLKLTKKGDLYFPGSIDFIQKAEREGLIDPKSVEIVTYLVPAINVVRGNPKNVRSLKDLCQPGLRVIMANPENVCLGVFAVEMFEKYLNEEEKRQLRKNIVGFTESCAKTANAISLKTADAVLGWSVFEHWAPDKIESIRLPAENIPRVSYLAIAVTKYCKEPELARKLIDFIKSDEGMDCFRKFKYFTTPSEAREYAGSQNIPIGGEEYVVPKSWINWSFDDSAISPPKK